MRMSVKYTQFIVGKLIHAKSKLSSFKLQISQLNDKLTGQQGYRREDFFSSVRKQLK